MATFGGEEKERGKWVFLFLFKIYRNLAVGFSRSEKKSLSTHYKLRVGTKILEFRQTPRDMEFSYFEYF